MVGQYFKLVQLKAEKYSEVSDVSLPPNFKDKSSLMLLPLNYAMLTDECYE